MTFIRSVVFNIAFYFASVAIILATLPVFVFAYARFYGASWRLCAILAAMIAAFIFGIYDQIMHVYWPESVLGDLFLDEF